MTPEQFIAWREKLGLSKVAAAKALGVSVSSVSLYENGKRFDDSRPVKIPKVVTLATEALTIRHFA